MSIKTVMDITPVLTYAGDVTLFQGLESLLIKSLPKEPVEWKRQYGRVYKSIYLKAKFLPFSKESLPRSGESKLIGTPILHTFWTDCSDVEIYRSSLKLDIEQWLKSLGGADFMIILVEVYDVRKSNKLLPRTTVLDKIRTDFALKQGDRVLGLIHPIKSESKSAESWRGLIGRIRVLMLSAYNKLLSKFEEAVRACRECRPQPNWSFCSYFLMQEELALVLEMLGICDDALVQYDELDALFTQFVVNSTKGEYPKWLASFGVPLQKWSGMNLNENVTESKRELMRYSKLDLLQFRSYLFGRQCSLLIKLKRPQEVAQRSLPFLYNCLFELQNMEVSAPEGAVSTWVFLVCLEVLTACKTFTDSGLVREYSAYTAGLWAYARDKLKQLGELCGVACDGTQTHGPTSEHLHRVVLLASGMDESESKVVERLKRALSSKSAFQEYFLELSELSISTYKHIGRLRCARFVGLDLAKFYIGLNETDKAVPFLTAALAGFEEDKWTTLATNIHLQLLQSLSSLTPDIRFISSCIAVACSDLDNATRIEYYQKFKDSLSKIAQDLPIFSSLRELGFIKSVKVALRNKMSRGKCRVTLTLDFYSCLPGPIECDFLRIYIEKGATLTNNQTDSSESCNVFERRLPMNERLDYSQDGHLNGANIVCRAPQKALLKRKESQSRKSSLTPVNSSNPSFTTETSVTLQVGENNIEMFWECDLAGRYELGQVVLGLGNLNLVSSLPKIKEFFIDRQLGSVSVVTNAKLLAGLPQEIFVNVEVGSYHVPKDAVLQINCSKGLFITSSSDWLTDLEYKLEEHEPFSKFSISLTVLADLAAQKEPDLPDWTHLLLVKCECCDLEYSSNLHFSPPMRTTTRIHTIFKRKIVQISVTGLTEEKIILQSPELEVEDASVTNLNTANGLPLAILSGVSANYLWELNLDTFEKPSSPSTALTFQLEYSSEKFKPNFFKYKCHFQINNYKTLFLVRCRLDAEKDVEFCRVGAMCHMAVEITKCTEYEGKNVSVLYEVSADQSLWAVCGRAAGVMTLDKEASQTVSIEIIPRAQGYLLLPQIRLSRYFPATEKESGSRPHVEPFSSGEVYNSSKSQQVHVLPAMLE